MRLQNRLGLALTLSSATLVVTACGGGKGDNGKRSSGSLIEGLANLKNTRDRPGYEQGRRDVFALTRETKQRIVGGEAPSLRLRNESFPRPEWLTCDVQVGDQTLQARVEAGCVQTQFPSPTWPTCDLAVSDVTSIDLSILQVESDACRRATERCPVTSLSPSENREMALLKATCKAAPRSGFEAPASTDDRAPSAKPPMSKIELHVDNEPVDFESISIMGNNTDPADALVDDLVAIADHGENQEFACDTASTNLTKMYEAWAEKAKALYGLVTSDQRAIKRALSLENATAGFGLGGTSDAAAFALTEVKDTRHAVEYTFSPHANPGDRQQETFQQAMTLSGSMFGGGTETQLYAGLKVKLNFKFEQFAKAFSKITMGGAAMPEAPVSVSTESSESAFPGMPEEMTSDSAFVVLSDLSSKTITTEQKGTTTLKIDGGTGTGSFTVTSTLQGGERPRLTSLYSMQAGGTAPKEGTVAMNAKMNAEIVQLDAKSTSFRLAMEGVVNKEKINGGIGFTLIRLGGGTCRLEGLRNNLPKPTEKESALPTLNLRRR